MVMPLLLERVCVVFLKGCWSEIVGLLLPPYLLDVSVFEEAVLHKRFVPLTEVAFIGFHSQVSRGEQLKAQALYSFVSWSSMFSCCLW